MILVNEDDLTIDQVVKICSQASLKNQTMTFDSFGTSDVRYDTMDFLYAKALTLEDAENVVNQIKVEDYFEGPIENYDEERRKRKLWIFKKRALDMLLYIKIILFNKNRCIAVISFHEDR